VPDQPAQPINAATRCCAVYGHPVRHSASPAMHNAALRDLRLNWRYLAFDVDPVHLESAIRGARLMGFVGLNLTVPHKILAVNMVDVVDPEARRWGAVNTIRFEGRLGQSEWLPMAHFTRQEPTETRSVGFNTDADAIVRAIREDLALEVAGKRIVILGAGGAGRAAALRLADGQPAEMYLINRTRAKAEEIAAEIREAQPSVMVGLDHPSETADLVLNATSLGLKPRDPLPVDEAWLRQNRPRNAFDMIYRPAETPFLKSALELGARTANGLGMLLHQGADSLEIWSGQVAPREAMRQALEKFVNG
jgi:shikimate dehydrogenase